MKNVNHHFLKPKVLSWNCLFCLNHSPKPINQLCETSHVIFNQFTQDTEKKQIITSEKMDPENIIDDVLTYKKK